MCCLRSENVTLDADSLRSEISDRSVRVVDVRKKDEYESDHIPGSVNLPLASLLSDDSPERVLSLVNSMGIDDETRVAVYDDQSGAIASRVAWTLEYLGHSEVMLLDTTYTNWKSLGLDTDSSTPQVQPKTHSMNLQPDILATHGYLEGAQARDDVVLVDNRERLNFLEQHIPGAINLPYHVFGTRDHVLRPKDEMRRLFDNRGIGDGSEIITYCGSVGTLSGLAYYALKSAGFDNARLYVRSFIEWKRLQKPTAKQEDANYWDLSAE